MQVILTENVPKLGSVGDICNVKPGYGRNYLLPRGLAIMADAGAKKQIGDLKRTEQRRQDKIRYEMMEFARRIGNQHLHVKARVGETGRLYGSVTAANIAEMLEAKLGEPIDRRKIILDESIRTLGDHTVHVHLMPGVDASVTLTVEGEDEEATPHRVAPPTEAHDEASGDDANPAEDAAE